MESKKSFAVEFKAADEHRVIGYASTWDREPDSYGDIVKRGAFLECIARLEEKGERLPLLFGHRTDDPFMNIGIIDHLEEDDRGLKFEAQIDMENENGAYAYKLLKEGRLGKVSFAYHVIDAGTVRLNGGITANELRKMDIFEISLVPIPANHHAEVVEVKAGKTVSKKNRSNLENALEMLEGAKAIIDDLLKQDIEEDEEKSAEPIDNAEEPEEVKAEDRKEIEELLAKMDEIIERN